LLLAVPVYSSENVYETGKLMEVKISDRTMPLTIPPSSPNSSSLVLSVPLGDIYWFTIQKDEITYFAACASRQKKSYAADWVINDPVQFRIDKDKLFLKRPNGKEMRLAPVMRVRNPTAERQISAKQMIPECR
jgi:hypothetical protein